MFWDRRYPSERIEEECNSAFQNTRSELIKNKQKSTKILF